MYVQGKYKQYQACLTRRILSSMGTKFASQLLTSAPTIVCMLGIDVIK
jgi:hypothetical protein